MSETKPNDGPFHVRSVVSEAGKMRDLFAQVKDGTLTIDAAQEQASHHYTAIVALTGFKG